MIFYFSLAFKAYFDFRYDSLCKIQVKEFGKLTGVSVRTLHHYDHIDLLKPSIRQDNGYRLYSEADLLKLQQIVALKFFGFKLIEIKNLLLKDFDVVDHFLAQSKLLEQQASQLNKAQETLNKVIKDCNQGKSINWKNIIQLIEDYRMKDELYYGHDSSKQKEYEKYLVNSGTVSQQQMDASKKEAKNWTKEKWDDYINQSHEWHKKMAEMIEKKFSFSSPEVQTLVHEHYLMVSNFWKPDKDSYPALGNLYLEHEDFRKFFDAYHTELAVFLVEAMKIYASEKLV